MIIVDNALKAREAEGRPIRVGMVGAGFMAQGSQTRSRTAFPACACRNLQPASRAGRSGVPSMRARSPRSCSSSQSELDDALRRELPVA